MTIENCNRSFVELNQHFSSCRLDLGTARVERDVQKLLFPAIESALGCRFRTAARSPDFLPLERANPDGEIEVQGVTFAVELKWLRGKPNSDAGEIHRGVGQCLAYLHEPRYQAAVLFVVLTEEMRKGAFGRPLHGAPGLIAYSTDATRPVFLAARWVSRPNQVPL